MAELIAKSALAGRAPVTRAGITLSEADLGPITAIQPWPGQEKALAKALKPLGLTWPKPGSHVGKGPARMVWAGRDAAFLLGIPPLRSLSDHAAVTDQTDGWCVLGLHGLGSAEALMRLVPMDLRGSAFMPGDAARTQLNHMPLLLMRLVDGFAILTFRSMARTAWHEMEEVMAHLAARDALKG